MHKFIMAGLAVSGLFGRPLLAATPAPLTIKAQGDSYLDLRLVQDEQRTIVVFEGPQVPGFSNSAAYQVRVTFDNSTCKHRPDDASVMSCYAAAPTVDLLDFQGNPVPGATVGTVYWASFDGFKKLSKNVDPANDAVEYDYSLQVSADKLPGTIGRLRAASLGDLIITGGN